MYKSTDDVFTVPASSLKVMRDRKPATTLSIPDDDVLSRSSSMSLKLSDIKIIMETLTDLQYAKRIKVASILSPKEISVPKLRLTLDGLMESVDPKLLPYLENHFKKTYPLEGKLSDILGKVLFDHGSYTLAVIPPGKIDELLKTKKLSGENFDEKISSVEPQVFNVVKPPTGKNKDIFKLMNLSVSDNLNEMKRSSIHSSGLESILLKTLAGESLEINADDSKETRSDVNGVVFYFPPDSVIPLANPTDPSDHLGYYMAIDTSSGMPVSNIKDSPINQQLADQLKDADSVATKLNVQFTGIPYKDETAVEIKKSAAKFVEMFERKVAEGLKESINTTTTGNIELPESAELYRVLLYKALRNEKVKMVYLPAELVTYFAFDYNEDGVGESLIAKTKLISSLRALIMVSDILNSIKNSTPITEVEIELDDDDPDHDRTVETIRNNLATLDKQSSPVGIFNMSDIITSLRKANMRVKISGGEAFPGTKTTFSDTQRSIAKVDTDLNDNLAKMQHSGIDVPSELIDRAKEGEFAISTHTTNHLWAMTNMLSQTLFITLLNDFIHKYIRFSPKLKAKIEEYKGEAKYEDIMNALSISLPRHDTASIESITEEFSARNDLIEMIVDQYVSADLISDLVPDSDNLDDVGDVVRQQIIAHFNRQWLLDNNVLPEVTGRLFVDNKTETSLSDLIGEYNEEMLKSITDIVNSAVKTSGKVDKKARRTLAKAEKERAKGDSPEEAPVEPTPTGEPTEDVPVEEPTLDSPTEDVPSEDPPST